MKFNRRLFNFPFFSLLWWSMMSIRLVLVTNFLIIIVDDNRSCTKADAFLTLPSPQGKRRGGSITTMDDASCQVGCHCHSQPHARTSTSLQLLSPKTPGGIDSLISSVTASSSTLLPSDRDAVFGAVTSATGGSSSSSMIMTDPAVLAGGLVAMSALLAFSYVSSSPNDDNDTASPAATAVATLQKQEEDTSTSKPSSNEDKDSVSQKINRAEDDANVNSKDDLLEEEDMTSKEIMKAYETKDEDKKGVFQKSVSKLVKLVKVAKGRATDEMQLREEAELKLKAVTQELLDMEDKYELEQTSSKKLSQELTATQSTLQTTQKQLQKRSLELEETQSRLTTTSQTLVETKSTLQETSTELSNLQEERRSLRKLGKVAWNLSKGRIQTRFSKTFGKR